MKRKYSAIIFIALSFCFLQCSSVPQNTITQISTIDALLAGVYDGHLACKELLHYGNFGIGTFDKLDGEMVFLDGVLYQVKADGKVYQPPGEVLTPFAAVSNFRADTVLVPGSGMDLEGLEKFIDEQIPNKNIFCGIKIIGTFTVMKTRSVPPQQKPYPPLVDVTKTQSVFDMENVTGTIVGFRCPDYVKGINVPGYHLHFLSQDFRQGGHILDFRIDNADVEIDECSKFFLIIPENSSAFSKVDLNVDRAEELEEVER
ncbi:acetolactate decarboxylase [candidate division KSB1 bacterium]|nr:acetolactate decarboxylase [candidate division KSB1 bacterium]